MALLFQNKILLHKFMEKKGTVETISLRKKAKDIFFLIV